MNLIVTLILVILQNAPQSKDYFGKGITYFFCEGGNFRVLCLARDDPEGRKDPFGKIERQYIRVLPTGGDSGAYATAAALVSEGKWSMIHYTLNAHARNGYDWTPNYFGPQVIGFDTMEWDALPGGEYYPHPRNYHTEEAAANAPTIEEMIRRIVREELRRKP